MLAYNPKFMSVNRFDFEYSISDLRIRVKYGGKPLINLIKLPTYVVYPYDPLNSIFYYDSDLIELSNNIFDTLKMLYDNGEHCLAALFASNFNEILGNLNDAFRLTGNHILCVPFWLSVIDLVQKWEEKHRGTKIHIGTPLYFLSEAYLLMQNNDLGFIYLIKSIEDDIELSYHCPVLNYPIDEPAYRTVCLIDNPRNHMYPFIVKPLRNDIEAAIKRYNDLFGKKSYLTGITDFDSKFLQKRNTSRIRIENIKYLFVLELVQLLRLRNIRIDSPFLQTLLLNRLFSLSLVVDKLLYSRYPPSVRKRGTDPTMRACVNSYANSHNIPLKELEKLGLNSRKPEKALLMLLHKRSQKRFKAIPREMFPILIAYLVRNTSAHKVQPISVFSSHYNQILQSMMESIFIIVGQMP